MRITNSLTLYIGYIAPTISHPILSPLHLKQIERSFIFLFRICIWSPSTILPLLHVFHSHFPSHKYHTDTLYLFNSPAFHYWFQSQHSKGFLEVSLLWVYFTLISTTPSITLLSPFLPASVIQQPLIHTVISSTLVCKYLYCILTYIPLGVYPGVVSMDHTTILFLVF
jgi:hypothetical protein